ncbi:MAG: glycosyltransferase family 2 protein [Deltaproteobacteria bacterium]|nr:glycosyltransferase family 2 protein [Deltaproteobacteria bacterium]
MEASTDISVVIPCLNEEATVGRVVEKTLAALKGTGLTHEVVVADNGSTDASRARAADVGARVVDASHIRGAGAATRIGASAARGRWIVLIDADEEHDPGEILKLIEPLRAGDAELVLGSRYKGEFLMGASSFWNRALGTPVLTALLNHFFGTKITDCNTGFRAMTRESFERISFRENGFEFCSEMIARAAMADVGITEVPITQHPGPEARVPHLRRWRDGWRHLKIILLYAPDRVLLRPGLMLLALGLLLFVPQIGGRVEWGPIIMDIHLMILGALFLTMGLEMSGSAVICASLAQEPVVPSGRLSRKLGRFFHLERALLMAAALFFVGLAVDVVVVGISAAQGFQGLAEPRLALVGTVGMGLAVQLAVHSFVNAVILQHRQATSNEYRRD